jgi:DNA-binding IclR family transcriptional regulator
MRLAGTAIRRGSEREEPSSWNAEMSKAPLRQALEKGFEIIELMADHPDGLLISEMLTQLGRTVGELFRIVIVTERLGYLRKSLTTDRYTAAYKLLDVAMRATPAQHLVRAALSVMKGLALAAGQSCHLVVPSGGHGLVVACEQQPRVRGFPFASAPASIFWRAARAR